MLNYNLNILGADTLFGSGSARSRGSNFLALWNWDFDERTVGVDAPNMDAIAHASFSLNAQNSNAFGISDDAGGQFESIEDLPVTASLSGSGQWPVTGSVTMSLFVSAPGGDADTDPYFFTGTVTCSAAEGNISSASGSIIVCETTSSKNFIYFVSASIIHHKGNEYNPLVKVLATGSNALYSNSQGTNTILNIIKDVNVPVSMSIGYITGSQTTEFQYDYAFNITASLTGSNNWPRSSSFIYPTSSLTIPEAGINVISYQTASIITASFADNTNTTYTITASIAPRYIPAFSASFYLFAGGAGGASTTDTGNRTPGGGGGAGAMFTGSFNIAPNRTYSVIVGSGGASDTPGDSTQFYGFDMGVVENIPITMSLQGGRNGSGMNGGNSGTGSYTIGTTTTQLPLFTGGSGDDGSGGGIIRFAAGGGAGSSQNGVSGIASPNRVSGNGGNGFVAFGGGGGGGGADRANFSGATRGVGGTTGGGDGGGSDSNQNGFPATAYGAGGGGATSTTQGNSGGSGYQGVLTVSYPGTGSRFTATGNYSLSYSEGVTTYTFNVGSSSFSYVYEPQLNPAQLT